MSEVTKILSRIEAGEHGASEELLPLVYQELRKLAASRLSHEGPGQTLQATALVHEVYLRLVDVERSQVWNSRGHFFAAAAEAMRRLLIERARSNQRLKRGGGRIRIDLNHVDVIQSDPIDLLDLDEALQRLEQDDPIAAQLV